MICKINHEHSRVTSYDFSVKAATQEKKLPKKIWRKRLDKLHEMRKAIHIDLGALSPYSTNWKELTSFANNGIGNFAGAGGRYRFAKMRQISSKVDGIIAASSLYENTDMIIRLLQQQLDCPVLYAGLEGSLNKTIFDMLDSYLYYLK